MVLIRVIVKLCFKLWLLIYYPLAVMWKYAFSIGLTLVVGYILYVLFSGSPDEYTATSTVSRNNAPPSGVVQNIEVVEDGNSAFSADLIVRMSDPERLHYSQLFYWVMTHQPADQPYKWQHYNMHGTLTPGRSFKNKLGAYCRPFTEALKVQNIEQKLDGVACEKGGGSWCKLRNNSTPACNLGRKGGIGLWWSDTKRKIKGWF